MDVDSDSLRSAMAPHDPDDSDAADDAYDAAMPSDFPMNTRETPQALPRSEVATCFHYMVNMPPAIRENVKSSEDLYEVLEQYYERQYFKDQLIEEKRYSEELYAGFKSTGRLHLEPEIFAEKVSNFLQ